MMKHHFKRTAAFTIAGAIMLGSAAMPTLALEEIPEVDDIPATADNTGSADKETPESEIKITKSSPKVQLNSLDELTEIDRINFAFTVSDNFVGEITENVADTGKVVNGILQHYIRGTEQYQYYILTLSGDKGEISLWHLEYGSLERTNHYTNAPLYFSQCYRVEDNRLVRYNPNEYAEYNNDFYLQVKSTGESIKEVSFNYKPYSNTKNLDERMTGAQLCTDIEYVSFADDKLSIKEIAEEKDEEKIIKDYIESNKNNEVIEQDPERYTTVVKGERNDGRMLGYNITFIAELPFEIKNADYAYLGDNIKLCLIGFENTLDGKAYRNDVMLRLSGDKDCLWFKAGDAESGINDSDKKFVKCDYNSLISFDGNTRVYNTISHKTLNVELTFSGDDMELDGAIVTVGNNKFSFDSKDIKYIGGGKSTYEKLW